MEIQVEILASVLDISKYFAWLYGVYKSTDLSGLTPGSYHDLDDDVPDLDTAVLEYYVQMVDTILYPVVFLTILNQFAALSHSLE